MSSHESYYSSSQAGPGPPLPPPKPSRSDTPIGNPNSAPPPPPPPPPHPSQVFYQQQQQQHQQQIVPSQSTQEITSYIRSPPPVPYSSPPPQPQTQTPLSPQQSYQPGPPSVPYHPQGQVQSPPPPPGLPQQPQQQQQQQQQYPSTFTLPENIKSHTTTDLSSLLSKPDLLSYLATQHPVYTESTRPIQSQIASNLALAQQISSLEAQVKAERDQTAQLLLQHTSLQTQWRRKQSEMDEALAPWGPRAMYQRLVAGIGEQEALLRAVYESFLDGGNDSHDYDGSLDGKATEKDVSDWIKRIREGTITLEKRKEVKSRWDEGRVGGWR